MLSAAERQAAWTIANRQLRPVPDWSLSVRDLVTLVSIEDHFLLLTLGPHHDLVAHRLDRGGRPRGSPISIPLPHSLRTRRRLVSGQRLFFAWSTTEGEAAVEELWADGDELRWRHHSLEPLEPPDPDFPVEILGLAASGTDYALIWRRGPLESHRSQVWLSTPTGHGMLEPLEDALVLEAMRWEGRPQASRQQRGSLRVVAGFEFSRPQLMVFELPSRRLADHRPLPNRAALPPGLRSDIRYALDADRGGLWLRRNDAVGDEVGEELRLHEGSIGGAAVARLPARAANAAQDLLVAFLAGGQLWTQQVRCSASARAGAE